MKAVPSLQRRSRLGVWICGLFSAPMVSKRCWSVQNQSMLGGVVKILATSRINYLRARQVILRRRKNLVAISPPLRHQTGEGGYREYDVKQKRRVQPAPMTCPGRYDNVAIGTSGWAPAFLRSRLHPKLVTPIIPYREPVSASSASRYHSHYLSLWGFPSTGECARSRDD